MTVSSTLKLVLKSAVETIAMLGAAMFRDNVLDHFSKSDNSHFTVTTDNKSISEF
ncbi:MAG: hypothetical protein MAG794_01466 [Gammaproteobacteria bacterium]|nr:hypothetical protein [Gammaproteobacteria bacterium]